MQLTQSPSLQTCKEYKKWTTNQMAIVLISPILPAPSISSAPPILKSPPRSFLQDTQSSNSKQCQWAFSNFLYYSISYRLPQNPQPSNIHNHQVASNAKCFILKLLLSSKIVQALSMSSISHDSQSSYSK